VRLKDNVELPPTTLSAGPGTTEIHLGTPQPAEPRHAPETGRMWEVEHGPRGSDELNLLKAGANYGRARHPRHRLQRRRHQPAQNLPSMEDR
jgi:hypothetical protein